MNRVDFAAIVTHAYFYLIREREFAIRGEDVYKLGITKQVMGLKIPRFDGYKKGSELVMITECPMALLESIETSLKKVFYETFQKHGDGHEFFIGNRREMAELIWKACSDAWTDDQQRTRADTLKSVLQLQGANNESESITHTLPSVQQKKAEKAAEEAEKAAKEAEKAAEEAQRISEEDGSFTRWFDERVSIKADAFVKQAAWYTDYRLWAVSADVVPLSERAAIATFKRLYTSRGISVGIKTYGIELRKADGNQVKTVPLVAQFLEQVANGKVDVGKRIRGRALFEAFDQWRLHEEIEDELSIKSFGEQVKTYRGVIPNSPKSSIRIYTFNKTILLNGLIESGHVPEYVYGIGS